MIGKTVPNELQNERVPILSLCANALRGIVETIGARRAESGGVIGIHGDRSSVSHYHFDQSSRNSAVTYSPDYRVLNQVFRELWGPGGVRLCGFVHSHPWRNSRPSIGDESYAERILAAIDDLDCLWLPIVNTIPDTGEFRLTPWLVRQSGSGVRLVRGRIEIVAGPTESSTLNAWTPPGYDVIHSAADDIVLPQRQSTPAVNLTDSSLSDQSATLTDATFERVASAYDLNIMGRSRIISIGAGGAAQWLEDLARAGLGQFVLIDDDIVSETNLSTQQTYRKDIGRPKVDCIAERIKDINPSARTLAIPKKLDVFADQRDIVSDKEMRSLAFGEIDGSTPFRTVICGLTDDPFAQLRVNRIALTLGMPSLCAQVYQEGRGAEITFTYPGITPACHRCILSSRYRHFVEEHGTTDVTSRGTPIFSTARLNAIKGFMMLALLHHGTHHARWGDTISRLGNRNLIQIRMDPDFSTSMGIGVFDRVFQQAKQGSLFFDESVWLPQEQECPATGYDLPCPDCGGTGDLRDAVSTIRDTRSRRPVTGDA